MPLPRLALIAAFAAGLLSLGSEVLWTRMLVFYLEGFTYTFSSMLTTFLLGLALGALVSGLIVNRVRDLRRYIGRLFLASGVVSAGVLWLLTHHFGVTNWAKDVPTAGAGRPASWSCWMAPSKRQKSRASGISFSPTPKLAKRIFSLGDLLSWAATPPAAQ